MKSNWQERGSTSTVLISQCFVTFHRSRLLLLLWIVSRLLFIYRNPSSSISPRGATPPGRRRHQAEGWTAKMLPRRLLGEFEEDQQSFGYFNSMKREINRFRRWWSRRSAWHSCGTMSGTSTTSSWRTGSEGTVESVSRRRSWERSGRRGTTRSWTGGTRPPTRPTSSRPPSVPATRSSWTTTRRSGSRRRPTDPSAGDPLRRLSTRRTPWSRPIATGCPEEPARRTTSPATAIRITVTMAMIARNSWFVLFFGYSNPRFRSYCYPTVTRERSRTRRTNNSRRNAPGPRKKPSAVFKNPWNGLSKPSRGHRSNWFATTPTILRLTVLLGPFLFPFRVL